MKEPVLLHTQNEDFIRGLTPHPASLNTQNTTGCMILFLMPFVLAGFFMVGVTIKMLYDEILLNTRSEQVSGIVMSKREYYDEGIKHHIIYRFIVDGVPYYHSQQVNEAYYYTYEVNDAIPITYAPSDPLVSRIQGTSSGGLALFMLLFTTVWSLFVGVAFYSMVVGSWRENHLRKRGEIIIGELHQLDTYKDEGNVWTKVTVGFTAPQTGQYIRGERKYIMTIKKIAEGDPVAVIYQDYRTWEVL